MTKSEAVAKALEKFGHGYNCAESVLMAGCAYLGVESELVPKIATAFGGGLSRCRSVCGALAGAAMVISIRYGRTLPADDRTKTVAAVQELVDWFRWEFGSDNCYEITGLDFNTPEGASEYKNRVHEETCVGLVTKTTEKLVDILER